MDVIFLCIFAIIMFGILTGVFMYKRFGISVLCTVFLAIFVVILLNNIEPKEIKQHNHIYKYEIQGNDTILVDSTETSERGYKVYYY